ncbi:MAG: hypothetical protein HYW01_00625 [Deltaproteobacteria bacterium]|nr:hypothetical protein [Deltaproteobacteria bacterium]
MKVGKIEADVLNYNLSGLLRGVKRAMNKLVWIIAGFLIAGLMVFCWYVVVINNTPIPVIEHKVIIQRFRAYSM